MDVAIEGTRPVPQSWHDTVNPTNSNGSDGGYHSITDHSIDSPHRGSIDSSGDIITFEEVSGVPSPLHIIDECESQPRERRASQCPVAQRRSYASDGSICERQQERKISLMELLAQREQRWRTAHENLCNILRSTYSLDPKLNCEKFTAILRTQRAQTELFHLFDWEGRGLIEQNWFVDHVKARIGREPGSREWAELLEVLAYVVCGEDSEVTEDLLSKILTSKGVLEKLFQLINKEGTGQADRQEVMDFIANLTYARPRTGFTKENLEWLEKLFRQALGHKQELSYEDFKKIVHSKNSFFAERVFQIFDRDKSGTVSLSEFLDAMHQFAGKSPNDKFQFLFRVYDLDGDGLIQQSELQQVLQACMEENGMKFSSEQIEDLTLAMFEDADADNQGEITYEALKAQLEKHNGLLENLSISIDRWLVPPQPVQENYTFIGKLKKLRPYQLTLPYIKNNYVYLSFLLLYCCINLSLFISRAIEYREHNGFTIVARACGQCLNFNCMFVLVLMLRQSITFLRTHGFGSFLPLDHHLYLHKMVGWVIFILSLLHTLMHLCNFSIVLVHLTEPDGVNKFNCSLTEILLTDCPQILGLVPGWANPTGVILIIILAVMVICSQPFLRKSGYFEVFYWTHLLYIGFFTLTILHGPNFWKWFVAPGVVFLIERTHRTIRMRTGMGRTYISSGVLLPSKVINLVIQRPHNFHFHPGDYVFVNIPAIAKYEWHPFTVSSAPEQDGALWLHIRAVGEWTNRLHSYFEQQQLKCGRVFEVQGSQGKLQVPDGVTRAENVMPMLAITEEASENTEAVEENNRVTVELPQRKTAVVNMAFEGDDGAVVDQQPKRAPMKRPPPAPQKIQSTPNFFKKEAPPRDKKKLAKSVSVPNLLKKRSVEEKKVNPGPAHWRTISDRRFDRNTLQRAREIAGVEGAMQEGRHLNSADRSVAQTFRYMRVKPLVITLDMPLEDDNDSLGTATGHIDTTDSTTTASMPDKLKIKKKHVTVVQVESPAIPRKAGEASEDAKSSGDGVSDDESGRRARYQSRRIRRISRLEEAEALGQCIGEPLEMYIDGPYGAPSSHIFRAQHAVLIATGIGVTPFASILQSIMFRYWKARHTCPKCDHSWTSDIPQSVMNLRKVDFFWINRDQRSFEWFVNLLSQLEIEQAEQGGVMDRFLDMHMYITSALQKTDMKAVGLQLALDLLHEKGKRDLITGLKTRTNAGRPNWDKVFKQLRGQNKGRITVFYCGPPALARTLRYKCDEYGFDFRKEIF